MNVERAVKKAKKKSTLSAEQQSSFFASQLFTLAVLEQVVNTNLDDSTLEHAHNAISVAAAALDRVMKDNPDLEHQVESIVNSFKRNPEVENHNV